MLVDRLLALTVAIEDAVRRGDWQDVRTLFSERGQILDAAPTLDPERVPALIEADARLHQRMESQRIELLAKLKMSRRVNAAQKLYSQTWH